MSDNPLTETMVVNFTASDRGPKSMDVKFISFLNDLSISITACRSKQVGNSFRQYGSEGSDSSQAIEPSQFSYTPSKNSTPRVSKLLRDSRESRDSNRSVNENFKVLKGERNKNGAIFGKVHLEYHDGEKFIGQFENTQRISGKVIFPSGLTFQGTFKNDNFDGKGILTLINGTTIDTQWKDGVVEPRGLIKYKNGDVYNGSMHRFKKDGFGELFMRDKRFKYVGEFKNGNIHGWGIYYQNERQKVTGYWRKGEYIGSKKPQSDSSEDSD